MKKKKCTRFTRAVFHDGKLAGQFFIPGMVSKDVLEADPWEWERGPSTFLFFYTMRRGREGGGSESIFSPQQVPLFPA